MQVQIEKVEGPIEIGDIIEFKGHKCTIVKNKKYEYEVIDLEASEVIASYVSLFSVSNHAKLIAKAREVKLVYNP